MSKKIIIASIVLAVILVVGKLCPSFAYIRDANIADSKDSLNLGWYLGLSFSAEKKLGDKYSIGVYCLPRFDDSLSKYYKNWYDITYNMQIAGEKDENYASSLYIGAIGVEREQSVSLAKYPGWVPYVMPYLGFAFSWKLNPYPAKFRLNIIYYLPFYFEFGYKIAKNLEFAASLGYPFQLVNLRYLF